ncbi:putative serpin-Z5 [Lolium perenne]|uniref:putative serpin-Z5 n=1 Tax=Lolium perenne TaxID=4522 RepID=UPI0021F5B182|nr:putative serpin-Z5 isoform X1 [Lolium perenne]
MPSPPLPKLVCLPLLVALALAATLLYAAGLHATLARVRPAPNPATMRDGQTTLALRLAKQLAPASGDNTATTKGNVAFSPVSIHAALSLVAAGARGATLQQLLAFLGAPSAAALADSGRRVVHRVLADRAASGRPRVLFGGGVWADASLGALKTAFQDVAVQSYRSEVRTVSFADEPEEVANAINGWVKKATNNLIDSIISAKDISAGVDLVLANAVYFKAKWQIPFRPSATRPGSFHRLDGSSVDAQFMSRTMYAAQYASCSDGFKVLQLPYEHRRRDFGMRRGRGDGDAAGVAAPDAEDDTRYSMYLFLPDERQGIAGMVDAVAAGPDYLYNVLKTTAANTVTVTLPKFAISFERDIVDDLRLVGLSLPFSSESADLRGIFEKERPTFLGKILHKAVVKVNEQGTEAAAVTMGMLAGAGMQKPVEFLADHPFSFFIMEERSGVIVFAGHVLDPTN